MRLFRLAPLFAGDQKLTENDRLEILRGLTAEYATVKVPLPRSPKPLPFDSDGTWDQQTWNEAAQKNGPAARVGDLVEITKVSIESDKIVLEINNGPKGAGGHWYDHVQVMAPIGGGVRQQPQQNHRSGRNQYSAAI